LERDHPINPSPVRPRKSTKMQTVHALGDRYLSWRRAPPATARYISGKVQTIMITLWGLVTISTGMMAHLDFDLAGQIDLHARQSLLFLGIAAATALLVPTHSHARFLIQTTMIAFCGVVAFLFTIAFNSSY
jgi:hypothetical protein